jgi:ribose 5-phosphate isomerase B
MPAETIAIAADHAGYELKRVLAETLRRAGREVRDLGTDSADSVDYPDFADRLAGVMARGDATRGVLICGSGIGMSIRANRHAGVRAALCHSVTDARLSRMHNDANVLVLGARTTGVDVARECLDVFLATAFEGGRHARRVDKLG